MAFLDNSGDIILDAVLTDAGRKRMAQGNFNITKFALGDDEIDYGLYNKNHPSGSAYYYLEILQTPVFEAFTQINAGINYGLLDNTATDLLYLPIAKPNELAALTSLSAIASRGGVFYVRDTSGDTSTATIVDRLGSTIQSADGSTVSSKYVLIETGLDTGYDAIPVGTQANRQSFLVANGLIDTAFFAFFDTRFISGINGAAAGSTFNNSGTNNTYNGSITLATGNPTSIDVGIANYAGQRVFAIANEVYHYSGASNTEESYSVIGGPRANAGAFAPLVKSGLDAEYTLYGTTGASISGLSGTYDYIDTTVYIQGGTTSATYQIPFRIIRVRT